MGDACSGRTPRRRLIFRIASLTSGCFVGSVMCDKRWMALIVLKRRYFREILDLKNAALCFADLEIAREKVQNSKHAHLHQPCR